MVQDNIFAVGCSFTWGESLQFFSNLDSVVWNEKRTSFPIVEKTIDEQQLKFIKENRWVSTLAKKLGVQNITQAQNGGTNYESLLKAKFFYSDENNLKDYKIFILQLTQFSRDAFFIKTPDGELISISNPNFPILSKGLESDKELLFNSKIANLSLDEITFDSYTLFYEKLLRFVNKLEEYNIKFYLLCYPSDCIDSIQHHPIKKYLVEINYHQKKYSTIENLLNENKNLTIDGYFKTKNVNQGDFHMTLESHNIIAQSLYDKLVNDYN